MSRARVFTQTLQYWFSPVSVVIDSHARVRAFVFVGKHVMSEKPIAGTIAEGAALADEYAREYAPRGLLWGILETYRFEAGLIRAAELTGDPSRVGSLMMVEGRFHTPIPPESRSALHAYARLRFVSAHFRTICVIIVRWALLSPHSQLV